MLPKKTIYALPSGTSCRLINVTTGSSSKVISLPMNKTVFIPKDMLTFSRANINQSQALNLPQQNHIESEVTADNNHQPENRFQNCAVPNNGMLH